MDIDGKGDDIYFGSAGRLALQRRIALAARRNIYARFIADMKPTAATSILDIGTSDRETRESNMLEKLYPYPENITCGTIEDVAAVRRNHPKARVVQLVPGSPLPFGDRTFDIAYSNGVLEHVGGPQARRFFITEALRVARAVFIVIPNAWFPLEHHTGIPLLHYAPRLFRSVLSGTGYDHWSRIENLDFVTARTLAREWPGPSPAIRYTGLHIGPLSSNIVAIARSETEPQK